MLQKLIKKNKLTQRKLSELLGITQSNMGNACVKNRCAKELIPGLTKYLNVTEDELREHIVFYDARPDRGNRYPHNWDTSYINTVSEVLESCSNKGSDLARKSLRRTVKDIEIGDRISFSKKIHHRKKGKYNTHIQGTVSMKTDFVIYIKTDTGVETICTADIYCGQIKLIKEGFENDSRAN